MGVGVVRPAVWTVDRRGESLDGARRLSASEGYSVAELWVRKNDWAVVPAETVSMSTSLWMEDRCFSHLLYCSFSGVGSGDRGATGLLGPPSPVTTTMHRLRLLASYSTHDISSGIKCNALMRFLLSHTSLFQVYRYS